MKPGNHSNEKGGAAKLYGLRYADSLTGKDTHRNWAGMLHLHLHVNPT